MSIMGSPGLTTREIDLSTYASGDSSTVAGFCGDFEWGVVGKSVLITSEDDLVKRFGYPVDRNYRDWFSAANYLSYSRQLMVSRAIGSGSYNASDVEDAEIIVNNDDVLEFNLSTLIEKNVKILARYPGNYGNKIRVCMLNKKGFDAEVQAAEEDEDYKRNPITPYISLTLRDDDIAIGVWVDDAIKEYGVYSIIPGSTDITGYENYLFKYFNNNSDLIYLIKENFNLDDVINLDVRLSGGVSTEVTLAGKMKGWDVINGIAEDDVQIIFQGGGNKEVGEYIIDIASSRKDCIACVSPMMNECVNVVDPIDRIVNGSAKAYAGSSYRFMDGNYKYQYDQYNDCYRWVPLNGDIAGIMAETDETEAPWISPGGKQIKNCVKLAFYPTKAQRDVLFSNLVNPVTHFTDEGNVLWGDWTGVSNTLFNFVGVRRLFLYMEKTIKRSAKKIMWKQNDTITAINFEQAITPFMESLEGGRGIREFKIWSGERTVTSNEQDRGIFRAKIAVKPINSIRYIYLEFVSVRSDISIDEVIE